MNWTDPANWTAGVLPGPTDDVVINNTGSTSVRLASGTQTVHSVTTSAPLTIAGGTLAVTAILQTSATITLSGGTIQGADIVGNAAAQFVSTSGTLNGVTLDLTASIPSAGRMDVQNGLTINQSLTLAASPSGATLLTFRGGQTVGGTGQLLLAGTTLNNTVTLTGAGTAPLIVAQGFMIHGQGTIDAGTGTIVNQGTIAADVTGQTLQITDGSLSNQAALVAGPGTLNLNLLSGWSNTSSGKLDVEGGSLLLGGAFTTAGLNLATFTRNGGSVSITGSLNNGNATLPLSPATGSWGLDGGTITGGTITASNGGQLIPSSGTVVGVTLNTDLTIAARSRLDVQGGLSVNGTLLLASDNTGGTVLTFRGAQTVSGSGQIVLGGTALNDFVDFTGGGTNPLVIAPAFPIHGMGTVDLGAGILLNQGAITSDIASQRLNITNGSLTNQGSLIVASQATLMLNLNNGLSSTSSGRIDVEGGALQLGGTFTTAGLNLPTFVRNGGSVTITGALDNSNATLGLTAATGPWSLSGGTITGGHISGTTNAQLLPANGTLVGVTLDTDLTIPARSSLDVQSGLTLNATLTIASDTTGGSTLSFRGGQSVGGSGQILLGGTANNDAMNFTSGVTSPLTIGSGIVIHGRGSMDLGAGTLINQGQIVADVSGQSLTIRNGALTNQGVLSAQSQGTLVLNLNNGWGCAAGGKLDVQGGSLQLGGTFTTPGLNLPAFTRSGGSVSITGSLDNTNSTFALTATTGSWVLAGGTITGGHLSSTGGAQLVPSIGTLTGIVIDSDMTIAPQSTLQIQGGLTLNAILTISGNSTGTAQLSFLSTGSVTGTGQIAMTGSANNSMAINAPNATVTLVAGITLHGQGSVQGLTGTTLVNQGTIIADISAQTLQINVPNFTSQGTATSANGGILSIASTNSITVNGGNVVVSPGVSPNSLSIGGGDVTFAGTLPVSLRSLTLSGGTLDGSAPVTLTGPANWTGGTIGGTGGITVPSSITLTVSGAAPHLTTSAFNNAGSLSLTDGTLQLNGGGSQSGSFALSTAAMLSLGGTAPGTFGATSSITGGGTFAVQDAATVAIHGAYNVGATDVSGGGSLELVPGSQVASIGTLTINGGTFTCGNAGLGAAPGPPRTATPAAGAGGTVNVLTAVVISGGTTLVQPGWTLSVGSSGLTFIGAADSLINLSSDPLTPARLALGGDLTFAGTAGTASIHSINGGAVPGQVDLGGTQRSLVVNNGSAPTDLVILANVTDGSLRTSGAGRTQFASPAGFTGGTTIAGGTLEIDDPAALGTGAVHFAGGVLAFGTGVAAITNTLTAAPTDSISLDVGSGSRQLPGLTLGAALNVAGSTGGSLVATGAVALQNDLTLNNSVPVTIGGAISGAFGITKTGAGSLTFAGTSANAYTGRTIVNAGSLLLDNTAGLAVPADLTINGPATVTLMAPDQISSTASVTFNSVPGPATLDLGSQHQSLGAIFSATAGATINLGTGTLIVGAAGAASSFIGSVQGAGTLVKQGAGTLTLGPTAALQGAALQVAGGTLALSPSTVPATNTLRSLTISPDCRLDVGNSILMINYGAGPSPADTIRSYLMSAYAGGAWSGPGVGTSGANPMLAYADSADGVVTGLPAHTCVVRPAIPGDINLDGKVDFSDVLSLAQHYGQMGASWDRGDLNYDGAVDFGDLLILAQHYGQSTSAAVEPALWRRSHTRSLPNHLAASIRFT